MNSQTNAWQRNRSWWGRPLILSASNQSSMELNYHGNGSNEIRKKLFELCLTRRIRNKFRIFARFISSSLIIFPISAKNYLEKSQFNGSKTHWLLAKWAPNYITPRVTKELKTTEVPFCTGNHFLIIRNVQFSPNFHLMCCKVFSCWTSERIHNLLMHSGSSSWKIKSISPPPGWELAQFCFK